MTPHSTIAAQPLDVLAVTMSAVAVAVLLALWQFRWYRLDMAPERPATFTARTGLMLALTMYVAAGIGALVAARIWLDPVTAVDDPEAPSSLRRFVIITSAAYLAEAIVVVAVLVACRGAPRPEPDRRWSLWLATALGTAALLAWWPVVQAVSTGAGLVVALFTGQAPDPVAHDTLRSIVDGDADPWVPATLGLVIIGAPVLEEFMYRYLLQGALRRAGARPWMAILGTSVVFAFMHATIVAPHALAALLVLSLGMGWVYERTGRLAAPIAMHVLFNTGNVVLAALLLE